MSSHILWNLPWNSSPLSVWMNTGLKGSLGRISRTAAMLPSWSRWFRITASLYLEKISMTAYSKQVQGSPDNSGVTYLTSNCR